MNKRILEQACLGGGIVLLALGAADPGRAEINLIDRDGLKIDFSVSIGAFYAVTGDTNFGAGLTAANGLGKTTGVDRNVDWGEGYVLPRLTGSYAASFGEAYAGIGVVGSKTFGESGDAGGFTPNDPEDVEFEDGYAGWRSGDLLPGGHNILDISAGRRQFQIGDGFLVWDGNFDSGEKGAFWLAPRLSFEYTAIARVDPEGPVRGDLFYLNADEDQGETELAGVNLEYVHDTFGTVGASYMKLFRSEFATRDDMDVFNLRAQGHPIPGLPDLFLSAEYVHEENDTDADSLAVDADAWYAEIGYTLSAVPWTPTLNYRFSQFSGDDPSSADFEGFDPLFYGFSRGLGTWFQGEIVGEYLLFNTNMDAHMVYLSAHPRNDLTLGLLYFRFDLDEPAAGISNPLGVAASGEHFADEINLHADWQITDNVFVSAVGAVAFPGKAAKQVFGDNDDYKLFEIYTIVTF